jgi:nicotinamide riboside transporter PnuC
MTYTDWIGTLGVSILLSAFFLNLFNKLPKHKPYYEILNIAGAAIACYASVLLNYIPFIILEASWALVSIIGLIKFYKK